MASLLFPTEVDMWLSFLFPVDERVAFVSLSGGWTGGPLQVAFVPFQAEANGWPLACGLWFSCTDRGLATSGWLAGDEDGDDERRPIKTPPYIPLMRYMNDSHLSVERWKSWLLILRGGSGGEGQETLSVADEVLPEGVHAFTQGCVFGFAQLVVAGQEPVGEGSREVD